MTPQQPRGATRTYPFVLVVLGAALIGVLYVNIKTREMTAQEVFGVDTDFDEV